MWVCISRVYSDSAYDRHIDTPNPRRPRLATVCCALFNMAALFALLTHHVFLPFILVSVSWRLSFGLEAAKPKYLAH
jgi:hypothetical protein